MTLVRYRPFGRTMSVAEEMNQMLDSFFGGSNPNASTALRWSPPVDVRETETGFTVRVEVPGVAKDQIQVNLENNTLTVRGEKKQVVDETKGQWHHVERAWGSFERSIALPVRVDGDKIAARYQDGVLEITVPKSDEAKPREIKIEG
jgi:HSP20 family protein